MPCNTLYFGSPQDVTKEILKNNQLMSWKAESTRNICLMKTVMEVRRAVLMASNLCCFTSVFFLYSPVTIGLTYSINLFFWRFCWERLSQKRPNRVLWLLQFSSVSTLLKTWVLLTSFSQTHISFCPTKLKAKHSENSVLPHCCYKYQGLFFKW